MNFTQIEPEHIYEIPSYRQVNSYSPQYSSDDIVPLVLGTALTAVLWVWFWWHVITKVGYRGLPRKLWIVALCIPPIPAAAIVLLLALPWPVHRQLRQARKQIDALNPELELDAELKQLRKNLKN